MFSFDEALSKSTEYFDNDDLAAKVFVDKYALKNGEGQILEDTPFKMHQRIAKEFARIEAKKFKVPLPESQIFGLLDRFKYVVPQGSPMFGIGNNYQTISLSNCYVTHIPKDSYSNILKTDEELVQICKRRGGVGTDLSYLRPLGAEVNNAAKSSTGVPSWMERYSNTIREVGQSNRRGALMLSISIHHPDSVKIDESQWDSPKPVVISGRKDKHERDIYTDSRFYNPNDVDFCSIKLDRSKVTGANVSIKLSDEFLNAVKAGEKFEQRFPVDYKETGEKPIFSKMVDARKVWQKIIHVAWQSAEPGLLFWDRVISYNPADCYKDDGFKTVSTNPCQPAWAPVLTKNGIAKLCDIKIGDEIWSKEGWTKVVNKWSNGVKDVYKYRTTSNVFFGTEDHKVVSKGKKQKVCEAESIDLITGLADEKPEPLNPQDIMDGLVIGDGSVHKASNNLVHLIIGAKDHDYFDSEISHLIGRKRDGLKKDLAYEIYTTITWPELEKTYNRTIPDRFVYGSSSKIKGFLRGLFSANGSMSGDRVTLKATSFSVIESVQLMLNSIGISSYYTTNKTKKVEFSNGEYECKQSYDINITKDRGIFLTQIGFIQNYKTEKLEEIIAKIAPPFKTKKSYEIVSVNKISEEEVFDIEVDNESHTYWTGGCDVSNCSELPLCSYDSCRLMVQNLFNYVVDPFTDSAKFDFALFSEHAKLAQRLMDDLVDLEIEKIEAILKKIDNDPEDDSIKSREKGLWENIREKCLNGRRTGLGIVATGDTIAALGLKYDSDEAIDFVGEIHKCQKLASYWSSVEMAKEIGAFPIWSWEKEKDNEFILAIKAEDPSLYAAIKKHGRRNIANLTIAPTGSVSLLTQTTSGIEPLFSIEPYRRRKKINYDDSSSRVDFVDGSGDKWQEFDVYHPKLKTWMEITGKSDIKESPWYGSCASDLNWKQRVKLQATAQKHVDHAISSTLNLPKDATEIQVAEIYESAWEMGCKGITVYRDGCRSGVLISSKGSEGITKTHALKRPKDLPCEIHYPTYKSKKYYVVVGMLNEEPYEVFTNVNEDENGEPIIPKSISSGTLHKKSRGKYIIVNSDKEFSRLLTNGHSDDNADALTRLISTSLRHGASIDIVIHQLEKTHGDLQSFSKVMARTLKKYVKDGTSVHGEDCTECGGKLVRENGCVICKSCGSSKCG